MIKINPKTEPRTSPITPRKNETLSSWLARKIEAGPRGEKMRKLIATILMGAVIMTAVPAYADEAGNEACESYTISISIEDADTADEPTISISVKGNTLADEAYRRALEPGARDCYSYDCDGCENCY